MDAIKLSRAREEGWDVFCIPFSKQQRGQFPQGSAWTEEGIRRINLFIPRKGNEAFWTLVFFHEIAHHVLGHTTQRTFEPRWRIEYDADRLALDWMCHFYDYDTVAAVADEVKDFHRQEVESYLSLGIVQHGELDAAVWAGGDVSLLQILTDPF